MPKNKYKLSFIIPAHNEERDIVECLDSLAKQPEGSFETIVVNDGSTDSTLMVVKQYASANRINLSVRSNDKGHSAAFARNRGAEIAQGEYLILLDADQLAGPSFVETVLRNIRTNKTAYDFIVLSYKPVTFIEKAWSAYRKAYPTLGFAHILKRSFWERHKFNEQIFYHEDSAYKEIVGKADAIPSAVVYHIDPKNLFEFRRQRRWQGKMASLQYFLPCLIPLLELVVFANVFLRSGDLTGSVRWFVLDLFGRYISLWHRLTG